MYLKIKKIYPSLDELNKVLLLLKNKKIIYPTSDLINLDYYNKLTNFNVIIEDKMTIFKTTFIQNGKLTQYIFRKDNADSLQRITGAEAFSIIQKYYKCPVYDNVTFSASPLLWKNEKYENTRNYAYCYDINSAYSSAMLDKIPDTSIKPHAGNVKFGKEIGFDLNGNLVYIGHAFYIFPLIDSPFKKFVNTWYNKKKNAKNKIEKQKAKDVLNLCVGYYQLVNPFLRAYIINKCNEKILKLIDENTLYCNTDSIVSLVPRDDIELSPEIGCFKLEHEGLFAYKGFNYQWNFDIPGYRHIPKSWFKNLEKFDLLTDEIPVSGNYYYFNKNTLQMEEYIYGKEI